ncbi:MAG: DUF1684 domain-containing protein [Ferruginibacter sp.]
MKKILIIAILAIVSQNSFCQPKAYTDSIKKYQADYVKTHEVVKGVDRKYLKFFPVLKKYNVLASFEKISYSSVLIMKTSGKIQKDFIRYGYLHFIFDHKPYKLTLYQSITLKTKAGFEDYLFLPFTDATSGEQTYGGGRYIDFKLSDIINNTLALDFNKAYNPYCAYTTGYNCPIPPRENNLSIAVKAGEMNFGKKH